MLGIMKQREKKMMGTTDRVFQGGVLGWLTGQNGKTIIILIAHHSSLTLWK